DLVDDFRECPQSPFALLLRPLVALAPTEQYLLHGLAGIEEFLGSSQHERYLYQLAHSLQLWMVGAWLLDQPVAGTVTLRELVLTVISDYFDRTGVALGPGPARSLRARWGQDGPQLVDLVWGLVAASHDIAAP